MLLEPFCLPVGHTLEHGDGWVAELTERQKLTARLAKKHGAVLVPCQRVFADAWVEAVRKAKWGK